MQWRVEIKVLLKESILDPQGEAVKDGLTKLDYKNVDNVQVGKYIELTLTDIESQVGVEEQVNQMCKELLANPVIEDYTFKCYQVGAE
ncbi:MAG: phosphoribosylformylglycinamidine synthase subunit PurS [Bacillota bacterium]